MLERPLAQENNTKPNQLTIKVWSSLSLYSTSTLCFALLFPLIQLLLLLHSPPPPPKINPNSLSLSLFNLPKSSMENPTRTHDREKNHPSPINSPHTTAAAGMIIDTPTGPPLTPKSIAAARSEPNPYPTTFVQADTSNFKHVVQMLTGSSETVHKNAAKPSGQSDPPSSSSKSVIPPIRAPQKNKQQGYKLYERRNHNHLKNSLIINTLVPGFIAGAGSPAGFSPREILSPSMLDFPKLALSPVTPLNHDDPFNTSSSPSVASSSSSEEEKAIAEKGFYLHPSPMNTPRGAEPPQLLPLFPVTSPRVTGASS